ncbi:LytTR family DNA-binding domain-containing protein [Brevundimonas sp.]|jgi:DNA-binding LytR/AlgR family response regulator|uniref:LytR/AlgR family response regulator transcription factor n=1 Tax=Brevundimonas sp. TaxID=1871086 RepID=UPI002E1481B0|nr:LytTR family DNA-binding domain-containing protein [Brevundimonas sp.]
MERGSNARAAQAPIALTWRMWTASVFSLASFYAVVFAITSEGWSPLDHALRGLCNAAPHVLMAVPLVERVAPRLAELRPFKAIGLGVASALTYATTSYAATIFLLALTARVEAEGIWVRFFQGAALPWQTFQSLTYAALALTAGLLLAARRDLAQARLGGAPAAPRRWLVRTADGILPIDPGQIVRIEADGECSRLILDGRSVLARIGMGECAARLSGEPFLRVHRSHLINGDAVVRAEPAGNGRLQLTLRNGDQVVTSRDGARLVREAVV